MRGNLGGQRRKEERFACKERGGEGRAHFLDDGPGGTRSFQDRGGAATVVPSTKLGSTRIFRRGEEG